MTPVPFNNRERQFWLGGYLVAGSGSRFRFYAFHLMLFIPRVLRMSCMLFLVPCIVIRGGSFLVLHTHRQVLSIIDFTFFSSASFDGLVWSSKRGPDSTQACKMIDCLLSFSQFSFHKTRSLTEMRDVSFCFVGQS